MWFTQPFCAERIHRSVAFACGTPLLTDITSDLLYFLDVEVEEGCGGHGYCEQLQCKY